MTDLPYSVARLAEVTGQSRRTVLTHITSGQLRAIKLSDAATSAWIIPADAAVAYIEARKAAA